MLHIRVPATSANMGPGFDCIGVALKLYNHIWVEEIQEGLEITVKKKQKLEIPENESSLIYRTMADFYASLGRKMPGIRMIQEDDIPMTRGLGSSAACIVAGLMAANALSRTGYTVDELAQIAARIEGHPDNSNPALYGGMVVGAMDEREARHVQIPLPENLSFAVMVPDFPMSTKASREVVPDKFSKKDAVFNSSRCALLAASMMSGKLENLEMAMEDRIHQPYRKKLIPNYDEIFDESSKNGAAATYLSGAGSTLMAIITDDKKEGFEKNMTAFLKTLPHHWELSVLKPDLEGAKILSV